MAKERVSTGSNEELFPEGHYKLTVKSIEKKRTKNGKGAYYLWKFSALAGGEFKPYSEPMVTWKLGPLLRALKCKEVAPEEFEWDREETPGMQIMADIVHERDKQGLMRARIKNPQPLEEAEGGVVQDEEAESAEDEIPF